MMVIELRSAFQRFRREYGELSAEAAGRWASEVDTVGKVVDRLLRQPYPKCAGATRAGKANTFSAAEGQRGQELFILLERKVHDSILVRIDCTEKNHEAVGVPMDKQVVSNALGGVDAILSKAKRALRELIYEQFGGDDDLGSYESPVDAMLYHFDQLYDHLLIVLEAAQMPEARADLIAKWSEFKNQKGGLRHTDRFNDFDHLTSPVLEYLDTLVSGLRMTVTNQMTSEEAWTLARLEALLEDGSVLVHRRKKAPRNEKQFQEIMEDYLRACFSDFDSSPKIPGTIKNFKPDCGIISIQAAIEFKLAHTEEGAKTAFGGVIEDTAGYKGSREWTRFYAVIYQAHPFLPKSHMKSDMKRVGALTWTPVLLNGRTTPKRKKRRLAATTASKKVAKRPR
jgi:hypothetical protein